MTNLEYLLIAIIYLLSCGFLSTVYILLNKKMYPKINNVLLMMTFAPVNVLASIVIIFLVWYDSIFGELAKTLDDETESGQTNTI